MWLYIICRIIFTFWLDLTYDQLEYRRTDDVTNNYLFLYCIKHIYSLLPCACLAGRSQITDDVTLGYRLLCHFFVLTTLWRLLWSTLFPGLFPLNLGKALGTRLLFDLWQNISRHLLVVNVIFGRLLVNPFRPSFILYDIERPLADLHFVRVWLIYQEDWKL